MSVSEYRLASFALERIAEQSGIVLKALNPLDEDDFITIVARLSGSLKAATKGAEASALKSAIDLLDVDWPNMSSGQKFRVYIAAKQAMSSVSQAAAGARSVLDRSAIVDSTRARAVKTYGLDIPAASPNESLANLLRRSQMVYIKDEYGNRTDAFDKQARQIVASGLERGLGRTDIAEELSSGLKASQVNRSKNYWNVVAGDFANKSRTASQIYSMDEAGITIYRWSSALIETTCSICRMMDGKTWSVQAVKRQLEYALELENPEDIKDARPWIRNGVQGNDQRVNYFETKGHRHIVAEEISPGKYRQVMSDASMLDFGTTVPPIHGSCKCTITTND